MIAVKVSWDIVVFRFLVPAFRLNLFLSFAEDDVQKVVSVCVDGKESQMVFIDHAHSDMGVRIQFPSFFGLFSCYCTCFTSKLSLLPLLSYS